jgi:outer membrane protein
VKQASLIINIVLVAAVVFLFIDRFTGKPEESPDDAIESDTSKVINYDIAYINSDSLVKKYQYFIDMQKEMESTQQKLQTEYRNRATGLQAEIEDFQKTAGNMTINQARAIEEDLMRKQQNLIKYQDNIRVQLLQEESKLNQKVYKEIDNFLQEYGKKHNLRIVLSYVYGGGIFYADQSLDITEDVISRLNDLYNQPEKESGTTE